MTKGLSQRLLVVTAAALLAATYSASGQEDRKVDHEGAGTAAIRGTVSVRPADASANQHARDLMRGMYTTQHAPDETPGNAQLPAPEEWKRSEHVVLYLEGPPLDRQPYRAPEKHPLLDQKNLEFHPRVLPILIGTTVDFPNRDNLFHNVFSYSQTKEFDLGRYPKNDSRSVTFDQPGVVRVYCDIHSHMSATILVLKNPFFAVPSDNGSYVIQHIPEGKYTLVFWYDRDLVERRPVELKAGETLEVNFTF